MKVFLHKEEGFWTCLFGVTIVFGEERSMSRLWHMEWGVVKWSRWKNMNKWANGSETLGKINQMQFRATPFWQVACSLHAFCMHTCQDWVSQNWIDFDEECFAHTSSECFAIINWHICMHIFIMKSRMCANCQDCVLCMQSQSPSDMWTTRPPTLCRFFLWKGGSTLM